MKLHLPTKLYRAVLACCAVAAFSSTTFAEIPSDYTKVTLTSVDQLADYVSSDNIAFLISTNIANSTYWMTGRHQYWTDSTWQTHELIFSGFSNCAISCKAITLTGNGSVVFRENSSSTYGGAIYGDYNGTITLSGNGSVEFSGNSASSTSSSHGGAIYGSTITLSGNGSVAFSGNSASSSSSSTYGGAIYGDYNGTITLSGNGSVVFRENSSSTDGGAIYGGTITLSDNGSVEFNENSSSKGGAIDGNSITLSGNGSVEFSGNSTFSGGAIYGDYNGTITLSGNGSVKFSGNSSSEGGAIYSRENATITLSDNESIVFSENSSDATYGGAIYGDYNGTITLSGNGSVEFSGNSTRVEGGAIYGAASSTITLSNNESVVFSGNSTYLSKSYGGAIYGAASSTTTLSGNGSVEFSGNSSLSCGGAIYGYENSTITLSGNGSVEFSGNFSSDGGAIYGYGNSTITLSGNGSVEFSGNSSLSCGGAIYGYARSTVTLSNNESVVFSGNSSSSSSYVSVSSHGGAICGTTITLSGNGSVVFRGNYEREYISYRLRSVWQSGGGHLTLAAGEGQDITFYDTLYSYAGTVSFNADYEDKDGVTQKGAGDIVFSGKYAKQDLKALKSNYAQQELADSLTTEVYATTNLYGGRLRIEDGAIYKGYGITAEVDSAATVRLQGGTLDHAGYALTFNAGTTLEMQGVNNIIAAEVQMKDNSMLSFTVGAVNLTEAIVTLSGNFYQQGNLTVTIDGDGTLEPGTEYALFALASGKVEWSILEENPALSWRDSVLYYKVPTDIPELTTATWHGNASMLWNKADRNWGQEGYGYAYKDGIDVIFEDRGAGIIQLDGNLAPKSVLVNNSLEHDYTWSGAGCLSGTTALTKSGDGNLTINTGNTYSGGTVVTGGTLRVGTKEALGKGGLLLSGGILVIDADGFANTITTEGQSGIVVADGRSLVVKETIGNTGTLQLSGLFDASSFSIAAGASTHVDVMGQYGDSGFIVDNVETVTIAEGCVVDGGAFIIHSGRPGAEFRLSSNGTACYGDTVNYSQYTVGVGHEVSVAAIMDMAENQHGTKLKEITVSGGNLNVDASTDTLKATGGTITLTEDVTLGGSIHDTQVVATAGTLQAEISGNSHLSSNGFVSVNSANSYTGGTHVTGGILTVTQGHALGAGPVKLEGGCLTIATDGFTNAIVASDDSSLVVAPGYTFTLPGTITNHGTLSLKGNVDISSLPLFKWGNKYVDAAGDSGTDGFLLLNVYAARISQGNVVDSGATITHTSCPGQYFTMESGGYVVTNDGTADYSTYYLNTDSIQAAVSSIESFASQHGGALESIVMKKGTLTVNSSINALYVTGGKVNITTTASVGGSIKNAAVTASSGTLNANIGGTASLTVTGGNVYVTNANTYSGKTTITGGKLRLTNNGTLGSGSVTLTGGSLEIAANGFANTITSSGNSSLIVSSGYTAAIKSTINNTGTLTLKGSFDLSNLSLTQRTNTHIDTGGNTGANGYYWSNVYYATVAKGTTVDGGATFSHSKRSEEAFTLSADGNVYSPGTIDYTTYLLNGGNASVSAIKRVTSQHGETLAAINVQYGTLTVDASTDVLNATGGKVNVTSSASVGGSIKSATVTASAGTLNAVMSGSSTLTSSGSVSVTNANSYTGGTTISSGTLTIKHKDALGTGSVTLDGGTLNIAADGFANNIIYRSASGITVSSGYTYMLTKAIDNTATVSLQGHFDVSSLTLTTEAATHVDVGGVKGASGFARQTYYYTTVVNGPFVNKGASFTHGSRSLTLESSGIADAGGEVDYTTYLLTTGASATVSSIKNVASNHGVTLQAINVEGGTLTVDTATDTVRATGGQVNITTTGTVGGTMQDTAVTASAGTLSAALSGGSTLTIGGTVTVNGANTYTGGTQVNSGTLTIKHKDALGKGRLILAGSTLKVDAGCIMGAVEASGSSSISVLKSNVLVLSQTIANSGTLSLSGTIDASALSLTLRDVAYIDINNRVGASGFAWSNVYETDIARGTVVDKGVTITHNGRSGEKFTLGTNGTAYSEGVMDYTTYRLRGNDSADVYSILSISSKNGATLNLIDMQGGTLTVNTSTDKLVATGGTVKVTTSGTLGGSIKDSQITASAGTLAAYISGSSSLTTSGTVYINTLNTYTGGTRVTSGTLTVTNRDALGTGTVKLDGGTLNMSGLALVNRIDVTATSMLNNAARYAGELVMNGGTLKSTSVNLSKDAWMYGGRVESDLSGVGGVHVMSGTTTLCGLNLYMGKTAIEGGTLKVLSTAQVMSDIELGPNGTLNTDAGMTLVYDQELSLGGGDVVGSLSTAEGSSIVVGANTSIKGSLTLGGGSITFTGIDKNTGVNKNIALTGNLNLSEPTVLKLTGYETEGSYVLATYNSYTGSVGNLTIDSAFSQTSRQVCKLTPTSKTLVLTVTGDCADLYWKGGNGTWETKGSQLWNCTDPGVSDTRFFTNDAVTFAQGGAVSIVGNVSPSSVKVTCSGTLTFTGSGSIDGATSLRISGPGSVTINTANSYTGGTTISGGTVMAGSSLAFGSNAINLEGGKLNLNNLSVGNKIIASGGALSNAGGYSGAMEVNGALNISGNATARSIDLNSGSISGGTIGNTNIYAHSGTISSDISGNTQIVVDGDVVLNGTAAPTRGTILSNGNLTVNGTLSGNITLNGGMLRHGASGVVLANGQRMTLAGGTVDGAVTAGSGTQLVVNQQSTLGGGLTLGGGTLTMNDLAGTGFTNLNLTAGGALTVSSASTLCFASDTRDLPELGTVVFYCNSVSGDLSKVSITTSAPIIEDAPKMLMAAAYTAGSSLTVSDMELKAVKQGDGRYAVVLTERQLPLTTALWNGGNMQWDTTSPNWLQGSTAYAYKDGVDVVFQDAGNGTVTLVGTLAPKSVSVQNGSGHDYTWSGSGKLSGSMALAKSGSGTLTINTANTYTGGTTISGGTLHVGNKSALGTGAVKLAGGALEIAAGDFTNTITASGNSTLKVASGTTLALSKAIGNTGTLTMSGMFNASALTLTQGATTHVDVNGNTGNSGFAKSGSYSVTLVSGGSTVNNGATITHGNLPTGLELTLGTNGVATAGGTVDYSDYLLTGSDTVATRAIHAWNAGATVTQKGGTLTVDDASTVNTTGGTVKLTQAVALGGSIANAAVTASAGTITAAMSGSTSLTISGNVTLSGVKTYTGMTTVNSGTLMLDGGLKSDVTINGGTLNTGSGLTLSNGQDIQLKGGSISGNLTTSAGSSLAITPSTASISGALTLGGGTLNLDDNILNVNGALTLNSKTALTVSGSYGFGEHTLITANSISGNTSYLTVSGVSGDWEIKKQGSSIVLSITRAAQDIDFPKNGTWTNGQSGYMDGDRVTFTDCGTVTVSGEVRPGSMTVTGSGATTWNGSGTVGGSAHLTKTGSGTLTINTSNSFTGGADIKQGTVSAGADNALGTGAVTMQKGTTLKLNGRSLGQNDVTVQGSATLAAGNGGQVKSLNVDTQGGSSGQQGELLYGEKLALSGTLKTGSLTLTKGNMEGGSVSVTGGTTVKQGYIASNINGTTLEKTGKTRVEMKGANSFSSGVTVSQGQLVLLEGGSLAGDVAVKNGAALLTGKGVAVNGGITLESGADMHLRPGAVYELTRKMTANSGAEFHGNLATKDGSTLTMGAAAQSDNAFAVHGSLTLGGGALAYSGSLAKGTTYTLATATDGISNISGKSLYTLFNLSEAGYTITNTGSAITLQQKANVSQALQRVAAQGVPAGLAVEGAPAGEDSAIVIGSAPEVQYTEAPLTETAVNGVTDAMVQADWGVVQGARAFAGTLNGSHGNLRALGSGRTAVWANAFGSATRQSSNRGHAGADHQLAGASLGLETMVGSHGAAGIAIGHTWNRVNTFGMSRLKQDAQHAGAFGRARVASSGTNTVWIEGSASYGKTETRGQLGYSRERWTQNSGTLSARVNDVLQLTDSTALNFHGGLEYLATDSGCIEDLRTGSVQNLRGELGAGITHRIGRGVVFAEAALQGDMVRHNPQTDVGIRQRGANPGRIGGSITVGGAYSLGEHWCVNAAYTFEGAKHNNSHNASVGASYRF